MREISKPNLNFFYFIVQNWTGKYEIEQQWKIENKRHAEAAKKNQTK